MLCESHRHILLWNEKVEKQPECFVKGDRGSDVLALHCQSRGYDFVSYDEEDSIYSPTPHRPKGNYSKDFSHWYDKFKSTTLPILYTQYVIVL